MTETKWKVAVSHFGLGTDHDVGGSTPVIRVPLNI